MNQKTMLEKKVEEIIRYLSASYIGANEQFREEDQQRMEKGEPFSQVFCKVPLGEAKRQVCFRAEDVNGQAEDSPEEQEGISVDGDTLLEQHERIFNRATLAINGGGRASDKSYSTSVIVPLFKYGTCASRLVAKSLYLNTIKLFVQLTYWDNTNDTEIYKGMDEKRYYKKYEQVDIPFQYINHVGKIKECIRDKVKPSLWLQETGPEGIPFVMNDQEEIDIDIIGFTLDAGALSKKQIGKLAYPNDAIARYKSFRSDKEIISSEKVYHQEIRSQVATEFARFLALYCLCGDMESMEKLMAAYEVQDLAKGFVYNIYEEWALREVYKHLKEHSQQVRVDWTNLFSQANGPYGDYFVGVSPTIERAKVMELIQRLRNNSQLLANDELYYRVMEITRESGGTW